MVVISAVRVFFLMMGEVTVGLYADYNAPRERE